MEIHGCCKSSSGLLENDFIGSHAFLKLVLKVVACSGQLHRFTAQPFSCIVKDAQFQDHCDVDLAGPSEGSVSVISQISSCTLYADEGFKQRWFHTC